MPIVAKNPVEYMLKKQAMLDDYAAYAKMRDIYKKSADSIRDNGTPFFQSMAEPKTTLESYLDKSRADENLLTLLMNNLGANVGQAKQFIQHLDDNMKETLLDRFGGFEKIFEENFVSPKLNSLKGAFEIFIKEGIYDKKVINPSVQVITDWLGSLSQSNLKFASSIISNANDKSGRIVVDDVPTDVDGVLEQVGIFVRKFDSDIIGYSALYNLLERSGFPTTNLPRPTATAEKGDTPSNNISTPITRLVADADAVPTAPAMPVADVIPPSKSYDEARMVDVLDDTFKRSEVGVIARRYNVLLAGKSNQVDYPPKIKSVIYSKGSKDEIIRELVKRKYDPDSGASGEFLVFQINTPPFAKLGQAMRSASASDMPSEEKSPNVSDLPDPIMGVEEVKGEGVYRGNGIYRGKGIGMGVVFTK
tara:strand:- start:771 stop:2030 length:1260 start_codon:yes stop_codon:yes gene_type:complete